ncbi:zinc finger transcription factor YY1 isoform X4 [Cryptomeria japonica]|uniref:zinc finger transcription factor YY1 isoform X4 n=1 Tax=Cryptomeria japonica TaxID=3369 RepID=UPI0025AC13C8|nr:zinc finger transcription factor YY1 isoform X4 [Cryptomeria japonica]
MEHMQVGFPRVAGVKWVKEWVPQETILNNGKCYILKWVSEDTLKTLKEKHQEKEPEPEPVTPRIFLCSYEGCGKTFTEGGALRKHSHVHGEKQHVCHYEGCGKKFLDSSKLKRHFLIHTGEKHFVCPHEGCGKNLAHAVKLTPPQAEREFVNPKVSIPAYGTVTSDRPFICPYEGCDKCYIHEYKLNLHLRREHAGYAFEENGKHESESDDEMDQASDQETNVRNAGIMTGSGRGKLRVTSKTVSAANVQRKILNSGMVDLNTNTNARSFTKSKELGKGNPQEDSEETKEDQDDTDNEGWGHGTETDDDDEDEDDDEETEDDMD